MRYGQNIINITFQGQKDTMMVAAQPKRGCSNLRSRPARHARVNSWEVPTSAGLPVALASRTGVSLQEYHHVSESSAAIRLPRLFASVHSDNLISNTNVTRHGTRSIPKPPAICAHCLSRCDLSCTPSNDESSLCTGDLNVLSAARAEARKNFESNRHLQTGSDELSTQLAHAEEVAKFLRENVVQGQATDADRYRMRILWEIKNNC